jgi:GntR family transcriptional regulator
MPAAPTVIPATSGSVFGRGWRMRSPSTTPVHAQIADRLAQRITSGQLPVGARLPAERDLAETLGVSRMTVRQALAAVEQRGLLDRGVGRGTFVARPKVAYDRSRVRGFTEQVEEVGLEAGARVVSAKVERAGRALAAALEIDPEDRVTRVRRVRSGGDVPLTLEEFWVAEARAPGLVDADLGGSLYALLEERYDCPPASATESLEPVLAREHEAELLAVEVGSPLMRVERIARDRDGVPVEYAVDLHRGDRARFIIEVNP